MRGLVAAVFAIAMSASAQNEPALLAPLPIRDQFLLNNGFFFFKPEAAGVMAQGESRLLVSVADSNTFAKSAWISHSLSGQNSRATATNELADPRFHGEGPLFLADGEIHRVELSLRHGFGNHLELGVSVPVSRIGGGWGDRFIEMTHHALGIGNADRSALRENSEAVYIDTPAVHYVRNRSAAYALGDIALTGKYELAALEDRKFDMALSAAIEMPTGNARALDGSGSIDAGAQLIVSRNLSRSRIHATVGIIRLGADHPLGTQAQVIVTSTIAAARMLNERTSAVLQVTLSECPFRHLGLAELGRRSNQLSAGVQRQIGQSMTAYFALIENVLTYENSADAGVAWGIARKF